MVHTVGPDNMHPVGFPVVVIDFAVPDGIVMIAVNMIRSYCPPVRSRIMLAILGMGPRDRLAVDCIATDGMVIPADVAIIAGITIISPR